MIYCCEYKISNCSTRSSTPTQHNIHVHRIVKQITTIIHKYSELNETVLKYAIAYQLFNC